MATSEMLKKATFNQDQAAGGPSRRKLRIKSGDVVTVSLATSSRRSPFRVSMRFKSGLTVQRQVGIFPAGSPYEAIKLGWQVIRQEKMVEREGWSWVEE